MSKMSAYEIATEQVRDAWRKDHREMLAHLDKATAERDAALTEIESRIEDRDYWHGVATTAKDQRDAALAAVERVRAVLAEERAWHEHLVESGDAVPRTVIGIGKVESALDGAPEPEWEYRARTDYGRVVAQGSLDEIGHLSGHIWERRRKAGPWLPVEGESK